MIGKAHGLKLYESDLSDAKTWISKNSGYEIMDIKYSHTDRGSYVLIIYRT